MFMTIPTWQVILQDGTLFRVPESNLDAFLHVITFNRLEFDVRREPDISDQATAARRERAATL